MQDAEVLPVCDVFVHEPQMLDLDVFAFWLRGSTALEVVGSEMGDHLTQNGLSKSQQLSEVENQFRQFNLLKHYLHRPQAFAVQSMFQLSMNQLASLIRMYYTLSDAVLKQVSGKKLRGKLNKDMDEIAKRANEPVRLCLTQYNNIRRVWRAVSDTESGSPLKALNNIFWLPEDISRRYLCVLFLSQNRLEIGKRPLQQFDYAVIEQMAESLMIHWTDIMQGGSSFTPLPAFTQGLRDVRQLLGKKSRAYAEASDYVVSALQKANRKPMPTYAALRSGGAEEAAVGTPPEGGIDIQGSFDTRGGASFNDSDDDGEGLLSRSLQSTSAHGLPPLADLLPAERIQEVQRRASNILRSMVVLGANLIHAKGSRDLFIDIYERILLPLHVKCGLNEEQIACFFDATFFAFSNALGEARLQPFIFHFVRSVEECTLAMKSGLH